LHELERRHIRRELDGGIVGEHVLQETDPGLADAGFAVRQAREVRTDRARHGPEHGLGVRQRNAADEMHDGMPAVICAHFFLPFCGRCCAPESLAHLRLA
jgi:hypothetical protein